MDNPNSERIEEVLKEFESLMLRLENKNSLFSFIRNTDNLDMDLKRKAAITADLYSIINASFQIGNYRRAIRYIVALKKIENDVNNSEVLLKERITDYLMQ